MIGILGKKIGMTQIFGEEGEILPVTVIEGGPCSILRIKTKEKDGYNALQLGLGDKFVKEIAVPDPENYKVGQKLDSAQFHPGEFVDVVGTSIGRGFQGGIKRWHWSRGPESHGSMSHRAPGSIGASAFPSRVHKGHHLPGHMGNQRTTIQNLEVIKVDTEHNILALRGSVPGHKNSYLIIKTAKKKKAKVAKKESEVKKEPEAKKEPEKKKEAQPKQEKQVKKEKAPEGKKK